MGNLSNGLTKIINKDIPDRKVLNGISFIEQSDTLYKLLWIKENLMFFGNLIGFFQLSLRRLE
ncbi:hypothetical protein NLV77_002700 [Staphylococcus ureilyticus]|nr:hypothetical protein [Staphylococcus ureilyticus]